MTTIITNIPDNLKAKVMKFIEELGGEIISEAKPSKRQAVLKDLEEAFSEAKDIRDGKKQELSLEEILGG